MIISVIACGKLKRQGMHPAGDLYIGPYFSKARQAAEALGHPWLILSAKYGLLRPDQVIESYELPIRNQSRDALRHTVYRQVLAGMIQPRAAVIDFTPVAYHTLLAQACMPSQQFCRPLQGLSQGRAMHVMGLMVSQQRLVLGADVYPSRTTQPQGASA